MKCFDKNASNQVKALAMVLMLMHHLWSESRIDMYDTAFIGGGTLLTIGKFCKLCVGIYMFISGYGLMATYCKGTFKLRNRLEKTLLPFWFIIILAIPLLLYMDSFSLTEILKNAFLVSHSINGAWWFMQTYVFFVLLFPLLAKTFHNKAIYIPLLIVTFVMFQPLAVWIRPQSESLHYAFHYFPLLYAGMFTKEMELLDKLQALSMFNKICITIVLIGLRFTLGWPILNVGLIIVIVLWIMQMQDMLNDKQKNVFNFLGKMSMNMWLIHVFFILYGFHFSNPFVDLLWLYIESLVAAYVVFLVYNKISYSCGNFRKKWINR